MKILWPIWVLIFRMANAGRNDYISRFRQSRSRLMEDEHERYKNALSPVEKALHQNLLHLIETETADAALETVPTRKHRGMSSKKKDGGPTYSKRTPQSPYR